MQSFLYCVRPLRRHFSYVFELFLLKKKRHNSVENDRTKKKFKLVLKTTYNMYKKLVIKYMYQGNVRFPSLCLASENAFLSYFYFKKSHNSVENDSTRKKFKLVLKTTYKKLFLKYQDNARFPSMCLASENEFLSYFYLKNGHNLAENDCIRKKFTLFLKTTYKKLVLKYQGTFIVFGL